MSKIKVKIEIDKTRIKQGDTDELRGDSSKFRLLTKWEPTIPLKKTLEDTLNYWRENKA